MTDSKTPSIQDRFLSDARRAKLPVNIHILNGYQVKGAIIVGFDNYVILCSVGTDQMMIYKHAVSSVTLVESTENKSIESEHDDV